MSWIGGSLYIGGLAGMRTPSPSSGEGEYDGGRLALEYSTMAQLGSFLGRIARVSEKSGSSLDCAGKGSSDAWRYMSRSIVPTSSQEKAGGGGTS